MPCTPHCSASLLYRFPSRTGKVAGDDKKLHKVLDQQYTEEYSQIPNFAQCPVGELSDPNNRRLLINMICTMNATFPDYDFSSLKPDQFKRENLGYVVNSVNLNLNEIVEKQNASFLDELWGAIDQEIDLKSSEVLTYLPDVDGDPFNLPGTIWAFNYFFHNSSARKIVFLTCCCTTRTSGNDIYGLARDDDEAEAEEDDEEEFGEANEVEEFDRSSEVLSFADDRDELYAGYGLADDMDTDSSEDA
mmetsp:Transcript_19079/g.48234  ORF Transcript_19079/g.48234 Transcript_19079/m.48234 type:complete len:247 (-) Transcript_19079:172-912(-)